MIERIYYLAPDYDRPSWGTGLLYGHVEILRELGFDARLVHHHAPFRYSWLPEDVARLPPIEYLDDDSFAPTSSDLVVLPEVEVHWALDLPYPWRKAVFVQGSFLIWKGFDRAISYRQLGVDHALSVLPHVQRVVERFLDIEAPVVRPFIAPYFFVDDDATGAERERTILLYANPAYAQLGHLDHAIADRLIRELVEQPEHRDWNLLNLDGLLHREVAEQMKRAAFLVNLNLCEAFNTTVPEAMAAGCIPVCYEAYGGQDFLVDGHNAYCFPNSYVFPLVDRLGQLLSDFESGTPELERVRAQARRDAHRFTREQTAADLLEYFEPLAERSSPQRTR